jgi:outer membrane lipoprotein carrier protein
MKKALLYVIFSAVAWGLVSTAQATKVTPDKLAPIKKVIRHYNEVSSVRMAVKKSVYMALMGDTKASEGEAVYAKGRLRLEMKEPESSLIVMDSNTIWVVTPGAEPNKPQVAKITAKDLRKQSRAPLAVLLSREEAWKEFKVVKSEDTDHGKRYWLEPKDPKKWPDMRKISLTLAKSGKRLVQLSYEDELENKTEFEFNNITTDQKLPANTFKYFPPRDAEVTVYE